MRWPVQQFTTPPMGRWLAWRASGKGHQGWDCYAPRGTPIVAPVSGRVISVSYSGPNTNRQSWSAQMGFGHNITIDAGGGLRVTLAHMNQAPSLRGRSMVVGDSVSEGEQVGFVGDSGNAWAVGCHCHVQATRNGVTINPETLFPTVAGGTFETPFVNLTKAQVEAIQTMLNEVADAGLKVDGDYGKATIAAVTAWQKKAKLIVDGKAGKNTIASLEAAVEAKRAAAAVAEAARKAAELAAKIARESVTMFDLFWDNQSTGYLGTPLGSTGLPSTAIYRLFERRVNALRNGKPDTFNRAEVDIMDSHLRLIAAAAQTPQIPLDVEKLAKAINTTLTVDGVPVQVKDVDWSEEVGEAAAQAVADAMTAAVPRIIASLIRQQADALGTAAEKLGV